MEIKDIRNKLFEKLEGTGWDNQLRFFVKSSDFDSILEFLYSEVEEKRRFTPPLKYWFKPFQLCPFDQVKVVFIVPEGTCDPTLENGLAISSNESLRVSIQFYRFREALAKEYPEHSMTSGDLSYIAAQGVFLLNASITSQILRPGKHRDIWAPFVQYVIRSLVDPDIIFITFGETGVEHLLKDRIVLQVSGLPKTRDDKFEAGGLFSKINEQLKLKNKLPIVW